MLPRLTVETFDASKYPQNQYIFPSVSQIFHWKHLQNLWVPAAIAGDSNKLPVMSNSKNFLWQLDKEHD